MKVSHTSILVNDQERALRFYTEKLGFEKRHDIPMGDHRWLTVVAPASPDVEVLLEPLGFAPARAWQQSLFEAGIPITMFTSDDLAAEFERLRALGMRFTREPTRMGPTLVATFEDTCGNLIQLVQP